MSKNRILTAIIVGAILGLATEFIIRPYIEKPIEQVINK
jgi:hypothetical protein